MLQVPIIICPQSSVGSDVRMLFVTLLSTANKHFMLENVTFMSAVNEQFMIYID